ncbi:CAP domain-containing protein [Nonomuraea sp. SYSU D8015]|uniref:CAP domain-containing protein n=1 Tax=Nonomuraea sp. SYSU D8015 TaxID=2593644 RepID=UPI001CB6CBDC|nr:CAP domain-containing protein [Nonomuraea sp. SYSU D8015]
MRRQLQALACAGSLAALSCACAPATQAPAAQPPAAQPPAAQAPAAQPPATQTPAEQAPAAQLAAAPQAQQQACRVVAVKPAVSKGKIRGIAVRTGCADQARLRVRIALDVTGPDRVVKSGSKVIGNGRITAGADCTSTTRRYYVIALDAQGRVNKSRSAKLTCGRATAGKGFASAVETAVVKLTNDARVKNGCKPLIHDPKLHLAAERHSADMAVNDYFDHDSRNGRSFDQRITAAGFTFTRAAENIAKGQPTAAAVVRDWLRSPGHRANIMNCAFTHIGVGHHTKGPTWTQDFAAR